MILAIAMSYFKPILKIQSQAMFPWAGVQPSALEAQVTRVQYTIGVKVFLEPL